MNHNAYSTKYVNLTVLYHIWLSDQASLDISLYIL